MLWTQPVGSQTAYDFAWRQISRREMKSCDSAIIQMTKRRIISSPLPLLLTQSPKIEKRGEKKEKLWFKCIRASLWGCHIYSLLLDPHPGQNLVSKTWNVSQVIESLDSHLQMSNLNWHSCFELIIAHLNAPYWKWIQWSQTQIKIHWQL